MCKKLCKFGLGVAPPAPDGRVTVNLPSTCATRPPGPRRCRRSSRETQGATPRQQRHTTEHHQIDSDSQWLGSECTDHYSDRDSPDDPWDAARPLHQDNHRRENAPYLGYLRKSAGQRLARRAGQDSHAQTVCTAWRLDWKFVTRLRCMRKIGHPLSRS